MASINGLQNNSLIVCTIDGLTTINATTITENGVVIDSGSFVPYSGAIASVNMNSKSISNIASLQINSDISTSTVTSTGLITANTLKINSVPSGTISKTLAVDASGNVIQGSSASTTVATTLGTSGTTYYLTMASSSGTYASNTLFCDASTGYDLTYVPSTSGTNGTLYGNVIQFNDAIFTTLKLTAVLSGTISYILGITSTGQVVTTTSSSQPTITALPSVTRAYPLFVITASPVTNSPVYVDNSGIYWDHNDPDIFSYESCSNRNNA